MNKSFILFLGAIVMMACDGSASRNNDEEGLSSSSDTSTGISSGSSSSTDTNVSGTDSSSSSTSGTDTTVSTVSDLDSCKSFWQTPPTLAVPFVSEEVNGFYVSIEVMEAKLPSFVNLKLTDPNTKEVYWEVSSTNTNLRFSIVDVVLTDNADCSAKVKLISYDSTIYVQSYTYNGTTFTL